MRFDEETNTAHKCIHEALDYSYCDCSDQLREELQVKLPKIIECESCGSTARFMLTIANSISGANLYFGCRACTSAVLDDWMIHIDDEDEDIDGWEITRL